MTGRNIVVLLQINMYNRCLIDEFIIIYKLNLYNFRKYLVKYLCRFYGTDMYYAACKLLEFEWIQITKSRDVSSIYDIFFFIAPP